MSKQVKDLMTGELQSLLAGMDDCFVVGFTGIDANQVTTLRGTFRRRNVTMRVVKNSMACRALERVGREALKSYFSGPCAVALGGDSVVDLAKTLQEVSKKNKNFIVKGGIVEGRIVGPETVEVLSRIPSREALYSQIAGAVIAPVRNVAGAFNALAQRMAGLLEAYRKKLEEGAQAKGAE